MYGARGKSSTELAGYQIWMTSWRTRWDGTHGSGRDGSMRYSDTVPLRYGPVGVGNVSLADDAAWSAVAGVALAASRPSGSARPDSSAVRRRIGMGSELDCQAGMRAGIVVPFRCRARIRVMGACRPAKRLRPPDTTGPPGVLTGG